MKRSKGMTLMELLIAMGLSAMIMAATFVIVQFSAATYDSTSELVRDNNNTYDAVTIINQYIRTASFCAVSDNGKNLFVTVDEDYFGGTSGEKKTIRIAYNTNSKTLFVDRMDGSAAMIVSKEVADIEWELVGGGVKYRACKETENGTVSTMFSGFAYKRGR